MTHSSDCICQNCLPRSETQFKLPQYRPPEPSDAERAQWPETTEAYVRSLEIDRDELRSDLAQVCRYYGDENSWYDVNHQSNLGRPGAAPVLKMVIGSIDTEGDNWVGGRMARRIAKIWGLE